MSAIDDKYAALGGAAGFLGPATGGELATPDGVGRYRHYQHGSIYWHPSTGAWEIHGAIRQKWAELGWERSIFGYPLTDETATPAPNPDGRYNHFQGGSIYWHPSTGAHEVHGAIRAKWASLGWEKGFLGFPITDELATPAPLRQGRYNHFQGGSVYWLPELGAHEMHGAIRDLWTRNGWERRFGFPVTDETPMDSLDQGRYNRFQQGTICWTPEMAAWADYHGGDPDGHFGGSISLFEHTNFGGAQRTWAISTERPVLFHQNLVAGGINDKASSLKLNGLPAHCSVYLFEHPDLKGRWMRVNGGASVEIASIPGHMNDRISSILAVNHGICSIIMPPGPIESEGGASDPGLEIPEVSWNRAPQLFVLPGRKLRIYLDGTIEETWPDSYLHLSLYFRLYMTGAASIEAAFDSWHASYGGSFAGYANDRIGDRLHSRLDDPAKQAEIAANFNAGLAAKLAPLAAGEALGIGVRRVNFLPEGLEVVIADTDVGALLEGMDIPGLSLDRVPGQVSVGG